MYTNKNDKISLEDYKAELDNLSLNFAAILDQPLIIPKAKKTLAHHWRWNDVHRILHQSLLFQDKLPTGLAGAERRIVRLQNPGLNGETVTNTMSMSAQLLLPGEIARPHRHTPVAFRFFLKGRSFTTVHGERNDMLPGDLVLTPYMTWHDHGNDSDEPGIWIDGLDYPLVRELDAVIKKDIEKAQNTKRTGTTERRFGSAGLRPTKVTPQETKLSSMIHYRWVTTEAMLEKMAAADDASKNDDIMIEYVNPATGNSVFNTIGCYIQMIRPGVTTVKQREVAHKVYQVFRGSGKVVIGDQTFEYEEGDFFVIPSGSWHQHINEGSNPTILFSLQDKPAMERLGLYSHESE